MWSWKVGNGGYVEIIKAKPGFSDEKMQKNFLGHLLLVQMALFLIHIEILYYTDPHFLKSKVAAYLKKYRRNRFQKLTLQNQMQLCYIYWR